MKQYIYKPSDAGLADWPSGTLRLEGMDVTENPAEADVFVCPGSLRLFELSSGVLDRAKLSRLPYFDGREAQHVFFDVSDNFTRPLDLPIIFIRCDARDWMLPHDPNTIQMAWPAPDCAESIPIPDGGFRFDVSFQGWNWSDARKAATASCLANPSLKCDFSLYNDFFGYIKDQGEVERRTREFRRSIRESRISLCPVSIDSVFPYRYWETLSAARVPLLVGDGFVFPFADELDYRGFTVFCSSAYADKAGEIAAEFLRTHSDQEIIEMGKLGREAWKRWFDSRNWPKLHAYAVQKKLGVLQAA